MEAIAFCFPAWMAAVSLWPLLSMMSLACSSDLRRWLCTRLSAFSNRTPSSSYLKCRNVSNLVADYVACSSATVNKSAIMHHEQRVPYAQYDPSYENKYGNLTTTLSGSSYCSPPDLRNDPMINGVNGNVNIRVWCHDLRQVDLFCVKNRPSQPGMRF